MIEDPKRAHLVSTVRSGLASAAASSFFVSTFSALTMNSSIKLAGLSVGLGLIMIALALRGRN